MAENPSTLKAAVDQLEEELDRVMDRLGPIARSFYYRQYRRTKDQLSEFRTWLDRIRDDFIAQEEETHANRNPRDPHQPS